jgi:hypothetical protein
MSGKELRLRPNPRPRITWYPYCSGGTPPLADRVDMRPNPMTWRPVATTINGNKTFLITYITDAAPAVNEETKRYASIRTPASIAERLLSSWNRCGRYMIMVMNGKPLRKEVLRVCISLEHTNSLDREAILQHRASNHTTCE